jgi:hypothetical protein
MATAGAWLMMGIAVLMVLLLLLMVWRAGGRAVYKFGAGEAGVTVVVVELTSELCQKRGVTVVLEW